MLNQRDKTDRVDLVPKYLLFWFISIFTKCVLLHMVSVVDFSLVREIP